MSNKATNTGSSEKLGDKCQHPNCKCLVAKAGQHCSEFCKTSLDSTLVCECGHPECKGPIR